MTRFTHLSTWSQAPQPATDFPVHSPAVQVVVSVEVPVRVVGVSEESAYALVESDAGEQYIVRKALAQKDWSNLHEGVKALVKVTPGSLGRVLGLTVPTGA